MIKCRNCGRTNDDACQECMVCGASLATGEPASNAKAQALATAATQGNQKTFQNVFDKFDAGASPVSWNWYAAIFQVFWYMYKGMWPKVFFMCGLIYWALPEVLAALGLDFLGLFFPVVTFFYYGLFGNYDHYLYKRKSEFFWPQIPYQKLKIPFWTVVTLLLFALAFQGVATIRSIIAFEKETRPGSVTSFSDGNIKFGRIPAEWKLMVNPPGSFSIKTPRTHSTVGLVIRAAPGAKLIGLIETQGKEKIIMGLLAVYEDKPFLNGRFNSLNDEAFVNKAKWLAGAGDMPFFAKWFGPEPRRSITIEHVDISGHQWGRLRNAVELSTASLKTTVDNYVYWIVADGNALFVLVGTSEPYKDYVKAQVEDFLSSFESR